MLELHLHHRYIFEIEKVHCMAAIADIAWISGMVAKSVLYNKTNDDDDV